MIMPSRCGPVNLLPGQDGVVRSALLAQVYDSDYRGPARSYPVVPYYRALRDELEPSLFKDRIVPVGSYALSLHDLYPTPFSASQPMAGAEIQANFVEPSPRTIQSNRDRPGVGRCCSGSLSP